MVKYILKLFTLSLLLYSCGGVQKVIQENFDCYNGKTNLEIDSLINTDGFYFIKDTSGIEFGHPPFYVTFMFCKDGIVFYNLRNSTTYNGENIDKYLKNTFYENIYEGSIASYEGIYSISGDIIKVQYVNNPSPPKVWIAREVCFKVIDRNTLVEIDAKPIHKHSENDYKHFLESFNNRKRSVAKFVKMENMPEFECWLKKEKWFWCNEEDWESYMKSLEK